MDRRGRFVRPTSCRSASCAVAVMLAPEIEQKRLCISLEEGGCWKTLLKKLVPLPLLLFAHLFMSSAARLQAKRDGHCAKSNKQTRLLFRTYFLLKTFLLRLLQAYCLKRRLSSFKWEFVYSWNVTHLLLCLYISVWHFLIFGLATFFSFISYVQWCSDILLHKTLCRLLNFRESVNEQLGCTLINVMSHDKFCLGGNSRYCGDKQGVN